METTTCQSPSPRPSRGEGPGEGQRFAGKQPATPPPKYSRVAPCSTTLYLLLDMANRKITITSRTHPTRLCAAGFLAFSVLLPAIANAAEVGVAAPLSGTSELLGVQVRAGASSAAGKSGVRLEIVDDACSAEGGAAAAQKFVAAEVKIVVGFLCAEALEAAMPTLKQAGIPVITVGVRTDSLTDRREKTGWPVFRLGPRADSEQQAARALIPPLWRSELFAIIDDGTIYGRELAESVRAAAEENALKPVFVDTFRPELDNQVGLVGRLRKAGATHVFVGGDRDDVAIIGRDAKGLGMNVTLAGGEALRAAAGDTPLQAGTLMVGLPEPAEVASPDAIAALKAEEIIPEGYVLPAYAAVEIAATVLAGASTSPSERLGVDEFQTALGKIRFDAKGDLNQNPYRLFRFDGTRFAEVK
ncbi:branched-chain amino acid transport system substrate-binding protein [Mesorhizobium albiziae]|uniref:Branched-chain amino acid transport system substrate-binding protein n=2 Tax=Neomesorhizobium albiziae TaxID=335020 RepID=A0A1I3Z1Y7_9HYPH|nr:branched-chain amino acid transport system substrate-binding protein [Mesorhizobium albiziae]